MRKILIAVVVVLFLGAFGWAVSQKEALLANGRVMVLELAPIDPRSLMQGDYMELDFDMERQIYAALRQTDLSGLPRSGCVIVMLDEANRAQFTRLDDGGALQPNEARLKFRWRDGGVRIASGSFFFQEGHGIFYDPALYGELRVDEHGNALITRLLDEAMQPIKPQIEVPIETPEEELW